MCIRDRLHAAGQLHRVFVLEIGKADHGEQVARTGARLIAVSYTHLEFEQITSEVVVSTKRDAYDN